jgi:hypothetical protein
MGCRKKQGGKNAALRVGLLRCADDVTPLPQLPQAGFTWTKVRSILPSRAWQRK